MQIRELKLFDYDGFFECLNHLSPSPKPTFKDFANIFYLTKAQGKVILVCIEDDKLVGTGSIFFEQKFSRNGSIAAHIEDIVVLPEYRHHGVAQTIIKKLQILAEIKKAYRITLTCDETLLPLYQQCGYENHGLNMRINL